MDSIDCSVASSPSPDSEHDYDTRPQDAEIASCPVDADDLTHFGAASDAGDSPMQKNAQELSLLALQDDILTLIEPHINSRDEPPFSLNQLTVMALVMLGGEGSQTEIRFWMHTTFRYYSCLVAADNFYRPGLALRVDMPSSLQPWYRKWLALDKVMREGHESSPFRSFDAPIYNSNVCRTIHANTKLSTVVAEARVYLGLHKSPVDSGNPQAFRFLDLPPELRTRIYEMCLALPVCSRLQPGRGRSAMLKTAIRQDEVPEISLFTYFDSMRSCFNAGATSEILALLLTNKQICSEAAPVFYGSNTWYFDNVPDMSHALKLLSKKRRNLLTSIIVNHRCSFTGSSYTGKISEIESAFRMLADMDHLKSLSIKIDQQQWRHWFDDVRPRRKVDRPLFTINDLPGMKQLKQLRGLEEVVFEGDCKEVEELLKPLVTQEKEKPIASRGTRAAKRRSCGEAGGRASKTIKN